MALVQCPECGRKNVSDSAESCPDCGYGIRRHFDEIAKIKQTQIGSDKTEGILEIREKAKVEAEKKQLLEHQQRLKAVNKPEKPRRTMTFYLCVLWFAASMFMTVLATGILESTNPDGWLLGISIINGFFAFVLLCSNNDAYKHNMEMYNLSNKNFEDYKDAYVKEKEWTHRNKVGLNQWIIDNGYNSSIDLTYNNAPEKRGARFIVDEEKRVVILSETNNFFNKPGFSTPKVLPIEEIISCEIRENSDISGGIKRAVVGGVIAGETGAIVGAITAKEKVHSYELVFNTKNIQDPQVIITLIYSMNSNGYTRDSSVYTETVCFANKVVATVRAILV